jgi:hypothetical protein
MAYGRMNIWLRYNDCRLITDCWRTNLVIKTCSGQYLLDMERTNVVVDKIKAQFPADYQIFAESYIGEQTIRIQIPGSPPYTPATFAAKHINHIEVDAPPGCYIVYTRVCYSPTNENTYKAIVILGCGTEACVNLMLPTAQQCGHDFIFPFLNGAVALNIPKANLQAAAKAIMQVAEINEKDFNDELDQRAKEVTSLKDEKLIANYTKIRGMLKQL